MSDAPKLVEAIDAARLERRPAGPRNQPGAASVPWPPHWGGPGSTSLGLPTNFPRRNPPMHRAGLGLSLVVG
jgi:hypothetical protein